MTHAHIWTPLVLAAALSACAAPTVAIAPSRLAAPAATMRAARDLGADSNPEAVLHLDLATREIDRARHQAANGRPDLAELSLERAQADAELAFTLARESSAEAAARQAIAEVEIIRERVHR